VARRRDRLEALSAEIARVARESHSWSRWTFATRAPPTLWSRRCATRGSQWRFWSITRLRAHRPAMRLDAAEQLAMVDLNVRALTELTLRFREISRRRGSCPQRRVDRRLHAGAEFRGLLRHQGYVRSFSEALAQEMAPLGVKVSCLCPGPVETGFQARAGFGFTGAMSSMKPALVPASEVARQGYEGLMAGGASSCPE